MTKPAILATAAALALSLLTAVGDAKESKSAAPKKESYAVVQIGDDLKVIRKSELANLKKSTAEEDKRRMKDYDEAKKDDDRDPDAPELVKPKKRTVRTLKSSFKTEREANKWLNKYLDEQEETPSSKKSANW